jgi:hypothetical protein
MRGAALTGTEHLARGVGAAIAAAPRVFHDFAAFRANAAVARRLGKGPAMTWMRRVGALLILAALAVAPALAWRSRAAEVAAPSGTPAADTRISAANGRTGIGVELEVMHLHIELAWFESVPVSPGRRLVFSWLASPTRDE